MDTHLDLDFLPRSLVYNYGESYEKINSDMVQALEQMSNGDNQQEDMHLHLNDESIKEYND